MAQTILQWTCCVAIACAVLASPVKASDAEMPACFTCADQKLQDVELANDKDSDLAVMPSATDNKVPSCTDNDEDVWTVLDVPEVQEVSYVCAKIEVEDGLIGRGLITRTNLKDKFGLSGEETKGCHDVGYTSQNNDELKGTLCVCSTDRCNGATGVQISLSLAAMLLLFTRVFA